MTSPREPSSNGDRSTGTQKQEHDVALPKKKGLVLPPRKPCISSASREPLDEHERFDEQMTTPAQEDCCMVNALDKWGAEVEPAAMNTVDLVRLSANDRLVIPFTTGVEPVPIHWFTGGRENRCTQCNGEECVLCRIHNKVVTMDLLPVYDVITQRIGVLAIGESSRPGALRPGLHCVLRKLSENPDARWLVAICKPNHVTFSVTSRILPDDADDGAGAIRVFLDQMAAGKLQLRSVYAKFTNDELASFPEVAAAVRALGVQL